MKKYLMLGLLPIFTACVSTGSIEGVSEGNAVKFDYEQELFANDGTLKITMSDGETYTGKFVQSSTTKSGDEWVIGESSNDDSVVLKDSSSVSSDTQALLIGNEGSTMQCRFQLSDPDSGIDGGGIGTCRTSKQQDIALTF
jgi:hypothetical protein